MPIESDVFNKVIKICNELAPFHCDKCPLFTENKMMGCYHCYLSSGLVKPRYWNLDLIREKIKDYACNN